MKAAFKRLRAPAIIAVWLGSALRPSARWRRSPMGALRADSHRRRRSPHGTRVRRSCRYGACDTICMSALRKPAVTAMNNGRLAPRTGRRHQGARGASDALGCGPRRSEAAGLAMGHVEWVGRRKIDPEDARAVQLVLRPQGKRQAARVVGILDRMQRQFEEGIGAAKLEGMIRQMSEVEELCSSVAEAVNAGRR